MQACVRVHLCVASTEPAAWAVDVGAACRSVPGFACAAAPIGGDAAGQAAAARLSGDVGISRSVAKRPARGVCAPLAAAAAVSSMEQLAGQCRRAGHAAHRSGAHACAWGKQRTAHMGGPRGEERVGRSAGANGGGCSGWAQRARVMEAVAVAAVRGGADACGCGQAAAAAAAPRMCGVAVVGSVVSEVDGADTPWCGSPDAAVAGVGISSAVVGGSSAGVARGWVSSASTGGSGGAWVAGGVPCLHGSTGADGGRCAPMA